MLILQTCHTQFWPKTEMKQHWPPRTPVKYVSGSKVPCNKAWSPCKQTQRTYVSQKLAPRSLNKKLRSLDSFEVVLLGMVPPPRGFLNHIFFWFNKCSLPSRFGIDQMTSLHWKTIVLMDGKWWHQQQNSKKT